MIVKTRQLLSEHTTLGRLVIQHLPPIQTAPQSRFTFLPHIRQPTFTEITPIHLLLFLVQTLNLLKSRKRRRGEGVKERKRKIQKQREKKREKEMALEHISLYTCRQLCYQYLEVMQNDILKTVEPQTHITTTMQCTVQQNNHPHTVQPSSGSFLLIITCNLF